MFRLYDMVWLLVVNVEKIQQGCAGVLVRFRAQRPLKTCPFAQRLPSQPSVTSLSHPHQRLSSSIALDISHHRLSSSSFNMQRIEYSSESSDSDNFPASADKLLDRKMRKAAAQRRYYQKYTNMYMLAYLYLHLH